MTIFRFGGSDPREPQWWIEAFHEGSAIRFFQETVLRLPFWNDLVATYLINHPEQTYSEFLSVFLDVEHDAPMQDALRSCQRRAYCNASLLYHHGTLGLYKVGAYHNGCWIIASNEEEALDYYGRIAGKEIEADYRGPFFDYSAPDWNDTEEESAEWLPLVDETSPSDIIPLNTIEGKNHVKIGEAWIKDALLAKRRFPYLLGYGASNAQSIETAPDAPDNPHF